jgi:hypothetical protein
LRLLGEREAVGRAEVARLEEESERLTVLIEQCRREVDRLAIAREVLSGLAEELPGAVPAGHDLRPEPIMGLPEALIDFRAGHPPQDRLQDLVIAGDRGLGTAEHLAHHVVCHVVPQPEQHRDDRRGQGQHVRPADRWVLPRADNLPDPTDGVGELSGRQSCHTLSPRRLALDHLSPHN